MNDYIFMNPRIYEKEEESLVVPRAKEYAWDFENHELLEKNGKNYFVYEKEAIKIWLWKLFQTPRFLYRVYNGDYGEELRTLIGRGYTQGLVYSEAKRFVEEAVEYNLGHYVTDVENLQVDFDEGVLIVSFRAITIYGDFDYKGVI